VKSNAVIRVRITRNSDEQNHIPNLIHVPDEYHGSVAFWPDISQFVFFFKSSDRLRLFPCQYQAPHHLPFSLGRGFKSNFWKEAEFLSSSCLANIVIGPIGQAVRHFRNQKECYAEMAFHNRGVFGSPKSKGPPDQRSDGRDSDRARPWGKSATRSEGDGSSCLSKEFLTETLRKQGLRIESASAITSLALRFDDFALDAFSLASSS